ncbi:MAG TPA: hypothetical protein GXX30_02850 [Firmicutes bacterium]|nr:hypothetical protein [Candidatus Fermentithermobacillaceae bacterium]
MDRLGIWVAAILTLAVYSFLYRENVLYRTAEHIFVGVAAGHGVIVAVDSYLRPTLKSIIKGDVIYLVPLIIGFLIYTRFYKPWAWMSKITIGFLVGIGAGITLTRQVKPFFLDQIAATIKPVYVSGDLGQSVNNLLLVLGVVGTLSYFFFTVDRKGPLKFSSQFGRWTMMVAFGAAFGNTVMARISLFLGRAQFLLRDFLGVLK